MSTSVQSSARSTSIGARKRSSSRRGASFARGQSARPLDVSFFPLWQGTRAFRRRFGTCEDCKATDSRELLSLTRCYAPTRPGPFRTHPIRSHKRRRRARSFSILAHAGNVEVVDVNETEWVRSRSGTIFLADGLHFTREGHRKLGEALGPVVRRVWKDAKQRKRETMREEMDRL